MFIIVASSNAINLTDGLDGLAGIITAMSFAAYGLIAYLAGADLSGTVLLHYYRVMFCLSLV